MFYMQIRKKIKKALCEILFVTSLWSTTVYNRRINENKSENKEELR